MIALEVEYLRTCREIDDCENEVQKIVLELRKNLLKKEMILSFSHELGVPRREKPSKSRMVQKKIVACARAAGRAFRSASRRPALAGASLNGESEGGDGDCSDPPARRTNNPSSSKFQFRKLKPYSSVSRHFACCCGVPFSGGYSQ